MFALGARLGVPRPPAPGWPLGLVPLLGLSSVAFHQLPGLLSGGLAVSGGLGGNHSHMRDDHSIWPAGALGSRVIRLLLPRPKEFQCRSFLVPSGTTSLVT